MIPGVFSDRNQLKAIHDILDHLAAKLDARFSVRLWDGTEVPLGSKVDTPFYVTISGPGVIGSILRRPTLDNLVRQYASGGVSLHGGDTCDFIEIAHSQRGTKVLRNLSKSLLVRKAIPFLFATSGAKPLEGTLAHRKKRPNPLATRFQEIHPVPLRSRQRVLQVISGP